MMSSILHTVLGGTAGGNRNEKYQDGYVWPFVGRNKLDGQASP